MTTSDRAGSIVCGVDGSDAARRAIGVARRLADALDMRLVLVHAGRTPPLPAIPPVGVTYRPEAMEQLRALAVEAGERVLEDQVARADAGDCEQRVEVGYPAPTLVDVARREEAAFVVVGSRGLGGVAGLVLGSVSSDVVASSPCPVVVVREDG